ncbi:hypothetical protein GCM10007320_10560 [Pseudorhodoferax aquiterrae]|uniref:DUF4148 domain-containing protein n=1 Tax=Pseudorhodoferax aquiterrae TaxID=747304 RepID=A0ABQ3FYG0_9BURK|nr:DUF4148 domain-containing protein [Pseudorhodoferax aquiterrae]GHC73692.1 hypothetical protein GCM10007320_10560 [Pseudorhodoferax aquiterrae]
MPRTSALLLSLTAIVGMAQPALAGDAPRTREQVRAEVLQARAIGQLPVGGEAGVWTAPATGQPLSRAQVLRELAASGPAPAGEVGDIGALSADHRDTTRAAVRAQAVQALRAGTLPGGEL